MAQPVLQVSDIKDCRRYIPPLFKQGKMGAPNASISVLVAMSILKEGFGCSDEDLFEKCEFGIATFEWTISGVNERSSGEERQ